jgi:hypothetical protein
MPRSAFALLTLVCLGVFVSGEDVSPVGDTVTVAPMGAVQPALACGADGKLYLAYGADDGNKERQAFLCTSEDSGKTWSEPELVSEGAFSIMAGNTRGPQIALIDDTIVVTAFANFKKGDDQHLYCFRKRAKDKRFAAVRVTGSSARDMEGLHHMMVDGQGTMHVVWMDARSGGTEPWYASSATEGKSFKGEVAVYTAPGGTICPCCQPTVAGSGKTVVVQFRNKIRNLRDGADYNDMYAAVSTDGGKKWKTNRLDDRERWKG